MNYYKEEQIIEKLSILREIINYWHSLSQKILDYQIDIILTDRKNVEDIFKNIKGEVNYAMPIEIEGKLHLLVIMNSLDNVSPQIFAHEVMHWILKLEGYPGINNTQNLKNIIAVHINDLCIHRLLWKKIRSYNIEIQNEIDDRGINDLNLMISKNCSDGLELALLVADDIQNCSKDLSHSIKKVLKNGYHNAYNSYKDILEVIEMYNLHNPIEVRKCLMKLVDILGLEGNWDIPNEIASLKDKISIINKGETATIIN